jgi:pimeloyl-ACP methyl ester carboxylesterase
VESPDVAFIVLLAGTGLTGEEILYLQSDLILKSIGAGEKVRAMERSSSEQIFDVIKQEKNQSVADKKIRKIMTDTLGKLSDPEKEALGASEAAIEIQLKMIMSPWFRFFLEYDPKPTLMKVKCPVLAMCGQLDLQVPPKENLSAIEEALKAGGNSSYTIKELPGLNHLFQKAQTGAISEYARIEETMSPMVLETISQWILSQTEKMK